MKKNENTASQLEALMIHLSDRDGATREKARKSLVALGVPAVDPLTQALEHSSSDQFRWEAAKTLGRIGDERGIPSLVSALEDRNHDVAWLAAEALEKFKKAAWLPLLHALVKRGSHSVLLRQGAHHVLRNQIEFGFNDLLAALKKALENGAVPEMTAVAAYDVVRNMETK